MGKFYDAMNEQIMAFIARQHIFFVATAPLSGEGHVNVSPKGLDCFRILGPATVGYMDLISSGNETSAHTHENGRITLMFCAFEGPPNIVRLYGTGRTVLRGTPEWEQLSPQFTIYPSTRQLIVAEIHKVQTSCGYGVPFFDYVGERDTHFRWAEQKGPEGLADYQGVWNFVSQDGLPTPLKLEHEPLG